MPQLPLESPENGFCSYWREVHNNWRKVINRNAFTQLGGTWDCLCLPLETKVKLSLSRNSAVKRNVESKKSANISSRNNINATSFKTEQETNSFRNVLFIYFFFCIHEETAKRENFFALEHKRETFTKIDEVKLLVFGARRHHHQISILRERL